jgi:hypothetical protein
VCSLGDRRTSAQRQAEAGRVGLRFDAMGIDDDELVALDETERAATCAEERRRALDERVRDVGGRHRGREGGGELLHAGHLTHRGLGLVGGDACALAPSAHDDAHPHHAYAHDERCAPVQKLLVGSEVDELRVADEEAEGGRPADEGDEQRRPEAAVPDGDGDGADEERVGRIVDERNEDAHRRERGARRDDREGVAGDERPADGPVCGAFVAFERAHAAPPPCASGRRTRCRQTSVIRSLYRRLRA